MSYIFTAPLELSDVANLISSFSTAYYATKNYGGSGRPGNVNVETHFWTPDDIVHPQPMLPQKTDLVAHYGNVAKRRMLHALQPRASQFAAAVRMQRKVNGYWETRVKTRIFDKTLLEDILTGQLIPPSEREFVIHSIDHDWKYFDGWIEYRNHMLTEARRRISEVGSHAALRLLRDT